MKLFTKIAVGGTFDIVHTGHIKLLSTALKFGKYIVIGITSNEFAKRLKKTKMHSKAILIDNE